MAHAFSYDDCHAIPFAPVAGSVVDSCKVEVSEGEVAASEVVEGATATLVEQPTKPATPSKVVHKLAVLNRELFVLIIVFMSITKHELNLKCAVCDQ